MLFMMHLTFHILSCGLGGGGGGNCMSCFHRTARFLCKAFLQQLKTASEPKLDENNFNGA